MGLQKTFLVGGTACGYIPQLVGNFTREIEDEPLDPGDTIFRQTKMVLFKNPGTGWYLWPRHRGIFYGIQTLKNTKLMNFPNEDVTIIYQGLTHQKCLGYNCGNDGWLMSLWFWKNEKLV